MDIKEKQFEYRVKRSPGEWTFTLFNVSILTLLAVTCLFPFLNVLAKSLSSEAAILSGKIGIVPKGWQIDAYRRVITNRGMIDSLLFTIMLTVVGTAFNVVTTAMCSYALSKDNLPLRKAFWIFILITVFFSGGIIPTYLVVIQTGLKDTMWALILPSAIGTYNMIIMRTYFRTIPKSLEEAASIEGCSEMGVLFRIVIPLSLPIIATITLFYAVGHWNEFRAALFYMETASKYPLQLKLRQLTQNDGVLDMIESGDITNAPLESLKSASVMFVTIPILLAYPYLQKHFVKGVLIGSVKA